MKPKSVDEYLSSAPRWRDELRALRMILLDCNLTEELKWSIPVYAFHKKNIVGINGLKESVALAFFKGALLLPAFKKAFYALTPGRQRAYILYFSQAKQSKTREARVEKCVQQILNGKGLTD